VNPEAAALDIAKLAVVDTAKSASLNMVGSEALDRPFV